jgi:hypothetical protein
MVLKLIIKLSLILTYLQRSGMFKKKVPRIKFEPNKQEVMEKCGKLYNEELSNLYSLPINVRVIKTRMMCWVGHVTCVGETNP